MNLTEEIMARFRERFAHLSSLKAPPNVFVDMQGEFIDFDEAAQTLTARFPVQERYQNPFGTMQGGVIAAAIDNTFGPLSFLVAPPSVTMQLNTSFIKAVGPALPYIEVTARVDELTRRFLYMSARVTNPEEEVLALAQASCMILRGGVSA